MVFLNGMQLQNINVIDNGDGKAIASLANVYPEIVQQFLAQVEKTLGIDVLGTLSQAGSQKNGKASEQAMKALAANANNS